MSSAARRFELIAGTSSKFWEAAVDGAALVLRWGRIGAKGQTQRKELASQADARALLERLIAEKVRKGYRETTQAAKPASARATQRAAGAKEKPRSRAANLAPSLASISIPMRRFENRDGRAPTFWEIALEGPVCRTREGNIGASAKATDKPHGSTELALEAYQQQVSGKLWSGFVEQVAPGSPSPPMPVLADSDVPAQRAHLRALLDEADLSPHADALDACLKPAIALRLRRVDENDLPVGGSRFGGRPDLPPGTPWPVFTEKKTRDRPARSRPLDFVAQFRLEEITAHDLAGTLPRTGLLSFFVLGDYDADSSAEPDYLSVCRVVYHRGEGPLERTAPPSGAGRTWKGRRTSEPYLAHAVEAFPIVTLPPSEHRAFMKLRLTDDENERFFERVRQPFSRWFSRRFPGIRGNRLLGYRGRDQDREPGQILLLQSETDYSAQMTWGDADFLYYWITPAALASGKFDTVTSNYAD